MPGLCALPGGRGLGRSELPVRLHYLGLRNHEQARVTHLTSLSSKGMSLDLWGSGGVEISTIHFRNGALWAGAWDSVWTLRAGRPPL